MKHQLYNLYGNARHRIVRTILTNSNRRLNFKTYIKSRLIQVGVLIKKNGEVTQENGSERPEIDSNLQLMVFKWKHYKQSNKERKDFLNNVAWTGNPNWEMNAYVDITMYKKLIWD